MGPRCFSSFLPSPPNAEPATEKTRTEWSAAPTAANLPQGESATAVAPNGVASAATCLAPSYKYTLVLEQATNTLEPGTTPRERAAPSVFRAVPLDQSM